MKVFAVDEKHSSVNAELDLGDISVHERELIGQVLSFINEKQSRYNQYALGNTAEVKWDEGEAVAIEIS